MMKFSQAMIQTPDTADGLRRLHCDTMYFQNQGGGKADHLNMMSLPSPRETQNALHRRVQYKLSLTCNVNV